MALCAENGTVGMKTVVRNLLFGLSFVLMLGHSLVPHEHDPNANRPNFILWEVFSIDLGGDHLHHFAPTEVALAADGIHAEQLPRLFGLEQRTTAPAKSTVGEPTTTPFGSGEASLGHLSSWSRRPPPSSLA
ncbi:MAG: hypothetical protein RIR07_779 [Bacteroidota bacterium]